MPPEVKSRKIERSMLVWLRGIKENSIRTTSCVQYWKAYEKLSDGILKAKKEHSPKWLYS